MQLATDFDLTNSHELVALSHAELAACARLLALSVAEHRAKFGIIPLTSASEKLRPGRLADHASLPREAKSAFHEALHLVRGCTAQPEPREAKGHLDLASTQDKRRQLRLSVTAPIQVADPEGTWKRAATLRNISWGGAAVIGQGLSLAAGDRVRLLLPAARGAKIPILAVVLRASPRAAGVEYAMRFDSLSPGDEDRLLQVLEILMNSPQTEGRRAEARLVQRLEVEFGDAGEFGATIEDISSDGLKLTVLEPLEIDQSLLITLSSADTPLTLTLRGRVVHQTPVGEGDLVMYQVGLHFEHPTDQLRERVNSVIRHLALLRPSLLDERAPSTDSLAG